MQLELITNQVMISDIDVIKLREDFVKQYCAAKSWDKTNLSFEQILEIRAHKEWNNPTMMFS